MNQQLDAIRDLGLFKRRWPDSLRRVISGRHPLENYRELLLGKATGIKNVITFDTSARATSREQGR